MRPKRTKGGRVKPSGKKGVVASPAAQIVQKALAHHQAGELDEAEILYRKALKLHPTYPDALHLLGFLLHGRNKNEEAVKWIKKAVASNPKQPLFFSNLGAVYDEMGKPEEAIKCYKKALAINPEYLNAICNMGNTLKGLGKREEAIECHRKALKIKPDFYEGHNNLGISLQESGQLEEAIECYHKAMELNPGDHAVHNNLGYALQESGKVQESILYYKKALEIHPTYFEAYSNLGNALMNQGNPEEALVCYQNSLKINPKYQDAYNNLGNLLREQGKITEAIECYHKALEIQPTLYDAHNNLGNAYQRAGQKEEAIKSYRTALEINPNGFGAYSNMGFALQAIGDMEEAVVCYKRAMEIRPDNPNTHSIALHQMQWLCDWEGYQTRYDNMIALFHASQKAVNPFTFVLFPTTPEEQRLCSELYARKTYPVQRNMAASQQYAPNPERIKIGYFSCDFQNHATSLLMAELFEMHDHNRFEIKAYSYGKDDGKEMRKRIVAACDTFTDISSMSHQDAAQLILDDGVHILIEMKGYTNNTRMEIAALRPTPIVAAWLGYPGTSGTPFIDYILTDAFVTPPGYESHFTEKVVRLPHCYQPNDRKREIAERTPTRREFGLPEKGFVFASFNKSYKINPPLFDVWMRLLQGTPDSVLWLWEANETVMANLRREAEARGVDGSRIHFAGYKPFAEHLARYRIVDLALDTFPCTSHTTGSDALWAGCPMVTVAGETFAARVAGSLLANVGLTELITYSPEEYEKLILELANDPERMASIRQGLQANLATAPLFDSKQYTLGLEASYEAMWQRFQDGLQPDHIDIQPPDSDSSGQFNVQMNREPSPAPAANVGHTAPPPNTTDATPKSIMDSQVHNALQIHQEGRLDEAESLYRHILTKHPNHPETLHLLGFLIHQRGQHEEAAIWIEKAIAADPNQPLYYSNYGIVLCELDKREEAVESYRKALEVDPNFYNAHCNIGNALHELGEQAEAISHYRKALEIQPNLPAGFNNLGNALQGSKQWEEAIESYEQAITLKPEYLEAYNNMGFAYQAMGKYEEAIKTCQRALAVNPNFHDAYSNIGNALLGMGRVDEAIESYHKAIEINPQYRDAYNNLGNALLGQGKLMEAVSSYRQALEIEPNLYDAHNNLGNALQELGLLDEAIEAYRKALELKPDYEGALNNLGFALLDKHEIVEALACYQKAADIAPNDPNKYSQILHQMLHICDWTDFQPRYDHMINVFNTEEKHVIPFVFLSLPTTPEEQKKCAEYYIKDRVPPSIHGRLSDTGHYDTAVERIKVGYLSGDYQNHPVAYLMAELFDLHDRSRFEITAYSYGEDDGRDMRRRLMETSDHFVDLRPLTYEEAAKRIRDDGIHILIEMNGFTKGVRLQIPAQHPAPIQAVWLGYAGTIGAPFIDYILTDPFVTPKGYESHFTEKVVRLPDCFMPNDRKRVALNYTPSRAECELPEEGFIFVNFNKTYKMNPEMFDIWMRVMGKIPGSVLWMRTYNQWAIDNLRKEAEARGIDGSRLIFAPLTPTVNEHLARYRLADLAIDNFPYTSHSTGIDTLWAGCPLVTYVGETFATRVAGSLLTNLNLPELVTHTLEEYETRIMELATNPERLAALRQRLHDNISSAPLFDSVRFTMGMESAYEAMWQQFSSGSQPDHIDTPAVDITGTMYQERREAAKISDQQPVEEPPAFVPPPPPPTTLTENVVEEEPATLVAPAAPPEEAKKVEQVVDNSGGISPLFSACLQRAANCDVDAVELIDVASQLTADPKTQHLVSDLYRTWLVYNASNPFAHAIFFNYGCILTSNNNLEGAKAILRESIRLNPDFYSSYINLGNVLERMGSAEDAVACWQTVVDRLPSIKYDALTHKLSALKQIARASDSPAAVEGALRQSLEIKPDQRDILQQWINSRRGQCKWPLIEPWAHLTAKELKKGFAPLSLAAYSDDPLWQLANACMYTKFEYGKPTKIYWDHHQSLLDNRTSNRLRIGYLSSDIREHAMGYLTVQIYELHNRENVEVFIYYVGHKVTDHIQTRAKASSDHWYEGTDKSEEEIAAQMVADRIDILVDLNGHTQGAKPKLLAMRPAPIIVNWLGYPGTMGSPYHNYIFADEFIIPKEYEIYYSEKVMRLPCYQSNDQKRLVSDKIPTRQEEGLPEDTMVFSCLNGVQKITPYIWNLWMDILKQVPESVFWLLSESEPIKQRLRDMAVQQGVAAERLIFASRKKNLEHVKRFGLSDLGLDSTPYGSHTTASDGLWASVPILTLPGISFASRVCGSLVKAAGLEEFICSTPEEYVARAVELGRNREQLQLYRQKLAEQHDTCTLFDTPSLVKHMEIRFTEMWDEFRQGKLHRPDLSNLDIYQEIGIELDVDGVGRDTNPEYIASYREKLIEKDRQCYIRPDDRLWKK